MKKQPQAATWTTWDGGLDPEFDAGEAREPDGYEDFTFYTLTENPYGDLVHARSDGRRKRKTVKTDEPGYNRLPEEAPPGWAEP